MQEYTSKRNTSNRKLYPDTRHTATLRRFYNNPHRRLPQAFTQTHKRKQEKKLQLPCCASTHSMTAPSSCLAPLEHVRLDNVHLSTTCPSRQGAPLDNVHLSTTCASRPRAPLGHVRLSTTCTSRQSAPLDNVHLSATCASRQLSQVLSSTLPPKQPLSPVLTQNSDVRFSTRPLSPSTLSLSQVLRPAFSFIQVQYSDSTSAFSTRPSSTAPRSLLGALHPSPPIGRTRHPSPGLSSLRKQADTEPSQQRSARAFWRETSPPPRRVSIRPSGSVTTRCSFDGECRLSCV